MRNLQSVYPLFENSIHKSLMLINRSLEFDKQNSRNTELLVALKMELSKILRNLTDKPSIHLTNLGKALNDLYELDRTVDVINVSIHFSPTPDLRRSSTVTFKMFDTS